MSLSIRTPSAAAPDPGPAGGPAGGVDLGPRDRVPTGEGRTFAVAGRRVAVFHLRSGEVAATAAACPHRGGPLADGIVAAGRVVCPLHQRTYDLATGACLNGDDGDVEVFAAGVDGAGHIRLSATPP